MKRVAVVMVVLLAACGGKDKKNDNAAAGASTSSTVTTVAAGAGTATTTAAGATATTAKGTTGTTASHTRTATGGTVPASTKVKPPAPGVYTYDNTGTSSAGSIPPTTKVTISPAEGARQKSVGEEKDASGNGSTTTTVLEYRDDGLYLVSLRVDTKQGPVSQTFDFAPAAPVLFAPLPATAGRTWTVDLQSSDGCYAAHADAKVDATGVTVNAAGGSQVTDQVSTKTHITTIKQSGCAAFDLNQTQTIWFSPQSRLTVKQHTVTDGTAYGTIKVTSDETSVLRSTTPS
jgi:hypothetical protein